MIKRRALDITFAGGGLLIAVLLVVIGFVFANRADFARDYVKEQLGQQRITFATADKLTDVEKNWKPGSTCLVENAGKPLETGSQAECYGNYFIGRHMRTSAENQGWPNETYATMGGIQTQLRTDLQAAKDAGNQTNAADIQKRLDAATSLRSTFQTGETLRGLLLTTYGFSVFGEMAGMASYVAFAVAGLLVILSAAGFIHAVVTPSTQIIGQRVPVGRVGQREPA